MTADNQPNLFTGWELAQQGMTRAVDKANRDCDKWSDMALSKLQEYLKQHTGAFQTEDFRTWAYANGLPASDNARAFGYVMQHAAENKLITRIGYAPVSNPKAHGTPAAVWVKN